MKLIKFCYHIINGKKRLYGAAALLGIFLIASFFYFQNTRPPVQETDAGQAELQKSNDSSADAIVFVDVYLTADDSRKFNNEHILSYFDIRPQDAANVRLTDFVPAFAADILFNDYHLYYDANFNQRLDFNDVLIENYSNILITAHRENDENKIINKYDAKFIRDRFYLTSPSLAGKDFSRNLKSIKFDITNAATGKKIKSKNIYKRIVNQSVFQYFDLISDIQEFKALNPYFLVNEKTKTITLPGRSYNIARTIIVPRGYTLHIQPGAALVFAANASLVSYSNIIAEGKSSAPINFIAQSKEPWGVAAVLNADAESIFDYAKFSGGSDDYINGVYFSGMLSVYHAKVKISHSEFSHAQADDSLNIKYSSAQLSGNTFSDNAFDGIDFDFVTEGFIKQSNFYRNGNDGIDLSGSAILIEGNYIENSGDKCISVGEKSLNALIYNNTLNSCSIGIEIKDLSDIKIINNVIVNNKIGLNAYEKKPVFGGGKAEVYNSVVWQNEIDRQTDAQSEIDIYYSNIKDAGSQHNNFSHEPIFINSALNNYAVDFQKSDRQFFTGGNADVLKQELKIALPQAPVGLISYESDK